MTGGSITVSEMAAFFENSKSNENILENVTISASKESDGRLFAGIYADKNSFLTIKNVTVGLAIQALRADNASVITVLGGSFNGQVKSQNGSTFTLKDNVKIISDDFGLWARGSQTKITMTGGEITGKINALLAEHDGHIDITNVVLKTESKGTSAKATGSNSIINLQNTTIEEAKIGLDAQEGGTISMTGGSIAVSQTGASFTKSKNDQNKLEGVKITSNSKDKPLSIGINADQESSVTLKDVTVTKAEKAIVANDHSTITIFGGSFEAKNATISATNNSTIILTDNAQITSSDDDGVYAEGAESQITMTGGTVTTKNEGPALTAQKGGQIDATNVSLITESKGTGAFASANSTIKLHGDTIIKNTLNGLGAVDGGKITSENLKIVGGKAIDKKLNKEHFGIWTSGAGSEVKLTGKTTIENVGEGFYADGGSKIVSGDLTITGSESKEITTGVGSYESDSVIELNGKTTIQNFDVGLGAANNGTIKMMNGDTKATQSELKNKIAVKKLALAAELGGQIDLKDVSITSENTGLQFLALSDIDKDEPDDPLKHQSSEINLTNADLHVENGTGILIGALSKNNAEDTQDLSIGTAKLNQSKIHADVLLGDGIFWDINSFAEKDVKAISNGTFTLTANQSTLEGRADIAKDRNVHFDLNNNTTWTLKNSVKETDKDGNLLDIAQRSRSDVSVLNLNNSKIVFQGPTEAHYHTLHIGSGKPENTAVYNATGNAEIYFNTAWSDGAAIADQKTDRLLIHGDVSGTTAVYATGRLKENNVQANTSAAANVRGLSLIQVSGKAQENSFKLVNGYTTKDGSPDMYTLRAYGPESSQGKADIGQNLFDEKDKNFWDFRLQPKLLETSSGPTVNAPVPQTANYLVMPNALFYSGLTDMAKQNALLANIRISVLGKEDEKNIGFFLYTYGSTGTLSSERGPLKYGYGADIRYAALQAGATLAAIEGQNVTTHFGVVGTYGQLSFTPKDMADVSKSTLDKWSLTAYGSIQHDNGFYLDTLFSYGVFKGDIGNAIMGKTAKLNNAKMLSISTIVGKKIATGTEGLTFEPQAQLAYQHLMFKPIEDANDLTIDMNNPSQWLIRVGGRLTKTLSTENNRPMSFYGKVNFIKTFGDKGSITIGRDFDLDPMGPAIEGGVGINAQLSHNLSLHGDVSYQQKLQKTGISGASFSGGIRYQF
ncbi:autotransporter outer membrane beta-barrel domain-containing protein [Bartonella sp. 220]|nr:autotransporter outer membrane beta-barrel domain-containing protein [Bartonella sp. 220B]